MKAIVYSLFGYGQEKHKDSFDFFTYLTGLSVNVRLCRLVYPDWKIILETDKATYLGFRDYFDAMPIKIEINEPEQLTKAMLWRLKPVFEKNIQGTNIYTHILCRDLDSPVTYREAQAVQYWINRDKALHCITDSDSHNIAMMGGMIGVRPSYFIERTGKGTWDGMMSMGNYDWTKKGTDQTFMNNELYPKFAQHGNDSVTQHYLSGMPNSFLSDYQNKIQDLDIPNVPYEYKCTNDCCFHIGQSGWYDGYTKKIFKKYVDKFEDITRAEKLYPLIFYWNNDI